MKLKYEIIDIMNNKYFMDHKKIYDEVISEYKEQFKQPHPSVRDGYGE